MSEMIKHDNNEWRQQMINSLKLKQRDREHRIKEEEEKRNRTKNRQYLYEKYVEKPGNYLKRMEIWTGEPDSCPIVQKASGKNGKWSNTEIMHLKLNNMMDLCNGFIIECKKQRAQYQTCENQFKKGPIEAEVSENIKKMESNVDDVICETDDMHNLSKQNTVGSERPKWAAVNETENNGEGVRGVISGRQRKICRREQHAGELCQKGFDIQVPGLHEQRTHKLRSFKVKRNNRNQNDREREKEKETAVDITFKKENLDDKQGAGEWQEVENILKLRKKENKKNRVGMKIKKIKKNPRRVTINIQNVFIGSSSNGEEEEFIQQKTGMSSPKKTDTGSNTGGDRTSVTTSQSHTS